MIFLSVGTQLPFERIVSYLDTWLREQDGVMDAFGQVADLSSAATPSFPAVQSMPANEFLGKLIACDVFVSHAGMGNIITAIEHGRPIVIVPRLASRGEHRNDHQVDTATKFRSYEGVFLANDYDEFKTAMSQATAMRGHSATAPPPERVRLVNYVNAFITGRER